MNAYEFKVKAQDGSVVDLEQFKGKVSLIVNTATGCGFTPQYTELQQMYDAYHDQGFEILDFPCNQFGEQTPGSDEEVHDFCTGRYGITFPQYSKIDVNGDNAIDLCQYYWFRNGIKRKGIGYSFKDWKLFSNKPRRLYRILHAIMDELKNED